MKLEILNEKSEKLLNRKEMLIALDFDKVTPKEEEVKKEISEHFKLNPELLKICKIKQVFGQRKANVTVYLYNDKDHMNKVEIRHKKIKKETKKVEKKE